MLNARLAMPACRPSELSRSVSAARMRFVAAGSIGRRSHPTIRCRAPGRRGRRRCQCLSLVAANAARPSMAVTATRISMKSFSLTRSAVKPLEPLATPIMRSAQVASIHPLHTDEISADIVLASTVLVSRFQTCVASLCNAAYPLSVCISAAFDQPALVQQQRAVHPRRPARNCGWRSARPGLAPG